MRKPAKLIRSTLCAAGLSISYAAGLSAVAEPEEHTIIIAGVAGTPGTWYKIEVEGSVEKVDGELDGFLVTAEPDDIALGNLVRGEVLAGDADGFRVLGTINTLLVQDGVRALVMVDGVELDTRPAAAEPAEASADAGETDPGDESDAESGRSPGAFIWTPIPSQRDRLAAPGLLSRPFQVDETETETEASETPPVITMTPIQKTSDLVLVMPSSDDKSDKGNETSGQPELKLSQQIAIFSGISGRRGEEQMGFDFASQPINMIGWNENHDKPCSVGVITRVDGNPERGRIISRCGDDAPFMCEQSICTGSPTLGVGFQRSVQIAGLRAGITSLEVCTNNRRNGRVKGLRITGGEIGAAGVGSLRSIDSDEMAHCRDWKEKVSCGDGSVATGIRAHFDNGGGTSPNTDQLVGLELICRAVIAD